MLPLPKFDLTLNREISITKDYTISVHLTPFPTALISRFMLFNKYNFTHPVCGASQIA